MSSEKIVRPRQVMISYVFPSLAGKKGADKFFYWDDKLPILQNLYNNLAADGSYELAENVTQQGLRYVNGKHSKDRLKSAAYMVDRLTLERYEKDKSYQQQEEAIMRDLMAQLAVVGGAGRNRELSVLHALYSFAQQEYVAQLQRNVTITSRQVVRLRNRQNEILKARDIAENKALEVGPMKAEIDQLQDDNAALQRENQALRSENTKLKKSFQTLKSIVYQLLKIIPQTRKFAENLKNNWKLEHDKVADALVADMKTLKAGASATIQGKRGTFFAGMNVEDSRRSSPPKSVGGSPKKKAT